MSTTETTKPLPEWAEQIRALEPVGDILLKRWGRANPTEEDRQDLYRLALSALANGYLAHAYVDPAQPVWSPMWNIAMNLAGPSPDYIYMYTEVDPKGVYQISGFRGTARFVEITQQTWKMVGSKEVTGPSPTSNDLDELKIGPDGYFSVILSAERPAGYDGDWWHLYPDVIRLLMRKCACDWRNEVDARMAINRLDEATPATAADFARRFANLPEWIEGIVGFDIDHARRYRELHGINVLTRSKIIDNMGGLPAQVYYDGAYEITDDEALIVDTALPKKCRYWQILVADDRFSTVDWVNRQSSLNDVQARVDSDGRFRAVASAKDPGVPNWLDKADNAWGILQMRWNKPSDTPNPVVTKVAFSDVRKHLPVETPVVTPEQRKEQLRVRREAAQLRQLW